MGRQHQVVGRVSDLDRSLREAANALRRSPEVGACDAPSRRFVVALTNMMPVVGRRPGLAAAPGSGACSHRSAPALGPLQHRRRAGMPRSDRL